MNRRSFIKGAFAALAGLLATSCATKKSDCRHYNIRRIDDDKRGRRRYKCLNCGQIFTEEKRVEPLPMNSAKRHTGEVLIKSVPVDYTPYWRSALADPQEKFES